MMSLYLLIFPAFDCSVLYRLIYRLLDHTCPASRMITLCEYGKNATFAETQQSLQLSGCGTLLYFPDHQKSRRIKIVSHPSSPFSLFVSVSQIRCQMSCSQTIDLFIRTLEFLVEGFFMKSFRFSMIFHAPKKEIIHKIEILLFKIKEFQYE